MIELTPELLGGSFLILLVTYFIAFMFQLYMMWLNIKQSRVNDQMRELIDEVKALRNDIVKASKKKTK